MKQGYVIMNKKAVALKYEKESAKAPKVVASGKGSIADAIIQKAEEFGVPIFANRVLVDSLVDLKLDKEIPAELYSAVVEVFIWLMKSEKKSR